MEIEHLYRKVAAHLRESAAVKQAAAGAGSISIVAGEPLAAGVGVPSAAVDRSVVREIVAAADLIAQTFRDGGKLLLCGNGGSAADCQHLAAEFTGLLTKDFKRPGLPAIALTTDTSFLTAYANDMDFQSVFSRQVQALGKAGDALIGISTSGNSENVIAALDAARHAGLRTIALTGNAGRLRAVADIAIAVPSARTAHIQEAHIAIEHVICDLVEQILYGPREPATGAVTPDALV